MTGFIFLFRVRCAPSAHRFHWILGVAGVKFLKDAEAKTYDVIIVDSSDPIGIVSDASSS